MRKVMRSIPLEITDPEMAAIFKCIMVVNTGAVYVAYQSQVVLDQITIGDMGLFSIPFVVEAPITLHTRPIEQVTEDQATEDQRTSITEMFKTLVAKKPPQQEPAPGTASWQTGKWTCSTNEENFDCMEHLDTEDEAIAYGKETFCPEMGVDDGDLFYTGQIVAVDADDLAAGATDAERVVEDIEEHLCDNLGGDHVEAGIGATPAQVADLDERLRACVKAWVLAHGLVPDWCRIENCESHVYHQCAEVDSTRLDPANHPRCNRHLGHDGEHDFP